MEDEFALKFNAIFPGFIVGQLKNYTPRRRRRSGWVAGGVEQVVAINLIILLSHNYCILSRWSGIHPHPFHFLCPMLLARWKDLFLNQEEESNFLSQSEVTTCVMNGAFNGRIFSVFLHLSFFH